MTAFTFAVEFNTGLVTDARVVADDVDTAEQKLLAGEWEGDTDRAHAGTIVLFSLTDSADVESEEFAAAQS